jgi:hypothetical protein
MAGFSLSPGIFEEAPFTRLLYPRAWTKGVDNSITEQ